MKKVKGLSKTKQNKTKQDKTIQNSLIDTDNSMEITRGEGVWGVTEGTGKINGNGRRLDLGW